MKTRPRLLAAIALVATAALGGWLWLRFGAQVWLDAAIALCT